MDRRHVDDGGRRPGHRPRPEAVAGLIRRATEGGSQDVAHREEGVHLRRGQTVVGAGYRLATPAFAIGAAS